MKVLHLDSGREMRGGQYQVLALHRGLVRQGHNSLLLARPHAPLFDAAAREGLPVQPLSVLRVLAAAPRAAVVHAHDAATHTAAAILAKHPLVVSRRVAFPVRRSPLSRWKYAQPELFLAVSQFVAAELCAAGVPEHRIRVIYDGVAMPLHPAHGHDVIAVRSTDPGKGMSLAAEAAKAAGIGIKFSDDLARDLPQARAMLYLTRSEGLGSAILLAMAHGIPVIASRVGGIPEIIEDGVTGLLAPNEVSAIASALHNLKPELGAAARERVRKQFTEDHMVEQTVLAYRSVIRTK
jgi:glycosyltransferase involved in cell wall biosynthesis